MYSGFEFMIIQLSWWDGGDGCGAAGKTRLSYVLQMNLFPSKLKLTQISTWYIPEILASTVKRGYDVTSYQHSMVLWQSVKGSSQKEEWKKVLVYSAIWSIYCTPAGCKHWESPQDSLPRIYCQVHTGVQPLNLITWALVSLLILPYLVCFPGLQRWRQHH